jgi:hypothetical protein
MHPIWCGSLWTRPRHARVRRSHFFRWAPTLSQSAREAASCRIRAALRSICRTRCTTGAQSALHDTCHTARRDATTVQHTTQIATPRSLRCPSHGGALLCPHAARARPFAHGFRCDWLSSPRMPFGAALRRCMLDPSTQDPETSRSIRNFLRVHYKCAHAASGGLGERRTLSCSCGHRSASPTAWACASCRSRGKTS